MGIIEILTLLGIPGIVGVLTAWYVKRKIEANEAKMREREENQEKLILMMIQSTKANNVGITAIAKAVQRIPDAHCNGDMTEALEKMDAVQKEEQKFLTERGIKYLFE